MNPTCETCRFYVQIPTLEGEACDGICRRYPPTAKRTKSISPEVSGSRSWCGEHQPKPQAVNQYSSEIER